MTHKRIHIYLGDDHSRIRQEAKRRGVSISHLSHAALMTFLDADKDKREALVLRRFDRLSRQMGKIDRDLSIMTETLALFIHYQLAITPPVPVTDQAAAKAQARERFAQFITRVARRMAQGKSIIHDIVEEISPRAEDFFKLDLEADDEQS